MEVKQRCQAQKMVDRANAVIGDRSTELSNHFILQRQKEVVSIGETDVELELKHEKERVENELKELMQRRGVFMEFNDEKIEIRIVKPGTPFRYFDLDLLKTAGGKLKLDKLGEWEVYGDEHRPIELLNGKIPKKFKTADGDVEFEKGLLPKLIEVLCRKIDI